VKRAAALLAALVLAACGDGGGAASPVPVPGRPGAAKSSPEARALRRAYDGAPPVVPHADLGAACLGCHGDRGIAVPDLGFAPPNPHGGSDVPGALSRCVQCHVFRRTEGLFRESGFEGLPQDLRRGPRMYPGAPPVIPHGVFMRENCLACHDGPAARESIRTSHPERTRCVQCHVPAVAAGEFARE
jgi:cytochrome c-type protein NapB